MTKTVETHPFQAETRELLALVIHSLYTHKEIFLRELVSNASDALDKLRFEALTHPEWGVVEDRLAIRIALDPDRRTLEIRDDGIGMSREEVVANIGTIARSGTREFRQALERARQERTAAGELPSLIGQFGVGFYSSFMVAREVELETRRAGETQATRWRSRGEAQYELEDCEREEPGTTVRLRLKPLDPEEAGAQDFCQPHVVRELVRKYSDFVSWPIHLIDAKDPSKHETLNSQKPLWTRPKEEVEAPDYVQFYHHLTHDWRDPLETIHFKAEGSLQYTALLFLPSERGFDLFDPERRKSRLSLYVKRVFIMAECEELVPPWLRFVRGVVDSDDLPLNVSRETLQHARQMDKIRRRIVKKVLETLAGLCARRRADYAAFWRHFGPVLKEGLYLEDEEREAIARVSLFQSTAGDELCTLEEYAGRMKPDQEEIYVLLAADRALATRSPLLEAPRKRGFEVLLLTDPVDEFALQRLTEFQGRKLRRIDQGSLDLASEEERKKHGEEVQALGELPEAVRKELSSEVESVRFSGRLTDSPAVLVEPEHGMTSQMERLMRASGQDVPAHKRILELNAAHPVIQRLKHLSEHPESQQRFQNACEILLGQARIALGEPPADPARFARLVSDLLLESTGASERMSR